MSTIYIMQKEVPSLGLLTKVGMTTRDGQDRAGEYGGGGWEIVKQFTVAGDLRDVERRIHERLEAHRCHAAREFGLTEVFSCSASVAADIAADEIGADPSGDDRVVRMQRRTRRGILRKIMQRHQSEVAALLMDASSGFDELSHIDNLRTVHDNALSAMTKCGEHDPTFEAMLRKELQQLGKRKIALEAEARKQEVRDQRERQREWQEQKIREVAETQAQESAAKRKAIYEAGRAVEALKQELGMPIEEARTKLEQLVAKRRSSVVGFLLCFGFGALLTIDAEGDNVFGVTLMALSGIAIFFYYSIERQIAPLERATVKLEKAEKYFSQLKQQGV